MTAEEVMDKIDLSFYVKTEGCYVVSDEFNNFVIAHRCKSEEPNKINLDGDDLYIRFMQGDLSIMSTWSEGIDKVVFDRLNKVNEYKIYSFDRIYKRIQGTQNF